MSLLDRYIARQFIANIAMLFVALFAIILIIDFSLQFDEYTEIASRLAREWKWPRSELRESGLAVVLVLDLWWPRFFQLFTFMQGLVMVGAMGFTAAQMVRHREFVAMLAGGISLHRIARPILIVALAFTVLQALNHEVLLPRLAPLLTREKKEAGTRQLGVTRQPLCADSSGRLFYARAFNLDLETLEDVRVWERDERGLMTRRITAARAAWDGRGWVLEDGAAETRQTGTDARREVLPIGRIDTDLDPTALKLRRFEGFAANLSTPQLTELIHRFQAQPRPPEARIAKLERLRYGRFAVMLCNILGLLICMPFFVRREPANMVVQSLYCAPVAVASVLGGAIGATASVPGLPPQVSVFLPVMVLVPLAIASVTSVKT